MRLLTIATGLAVIWSSSCIQTNVTCNVKSEFDCGSGDLKCIPLEWICDNVVDCENGMDEKGCTYAHSCHPGYMMCKNGLCVAQSFKCDDEDDCMDGSDERHCEYWTKQVPAPLRSTEIALAPSCLPPRMKCASGQCIASDLICDGHMDCIGGDDELNCHFSAAALTSKNTTSKSSSTEAKKDKDTIPQSQSDNFESCRSGYTICASGDVCIPNSFVCDGSADCEDGSDEENCEAVSDLESFLTGHSTALAKCTAEGKFFCQTDIDEVSRCISLNATCDGVVDCPNGDDESERCRECSRGMCKHTCQNTPRGARCLCDMGWKLDVDGTSCVQEDACEEHGHKCQQYCEQDGVAYMCKCAPGYLLQLDGHSCRVDDDQNGVLFLSLGSEVRRMSLDKSSSVGYSTVHRIGGHGTSRSIDFSQKSGKLIMVLNSEHGRSSEGELAMSDNGLLRVLRENVTGIGYVAVDWIGNNIFFTQKHPSPEVGISVCTMNAFFCRMIIRVSGTDSSRINFRGLAVHPIRGQIVWIESVQSRHRIMIASMDGSDVRSLVDNKLEYPSALAIDYVRHDVYFGDVERRLIERVNMATRERRVVISSHVHHPFDILFFNGFVYWSDWGSDDLKVQELSKHHSSPLVLHAFNRFPYGIAINHTHYQPSPSMNPCESLECPWICVMIPKEEGVSTAKCVCPDGYTVADNTEGECTPLYTDSDVTVTTSHISTSLMREYCDAGVGCLNGGTCQDVVNSHGRTERIVCKCEAPYNGDHCEHLDPEALIRMKEDEDDISVALILFISLILVAVGLAVLYVWLFKLSSYGNVVRSYVDEASRSVQDAARPIVSDIKRIASRGNPMRQNHTVSPRVVANDLFTDDNEVRNVPIQNTDSPSSYRNPLYDEVHDETIRPVQSNYQAIGSSSPVAGSVSFRTNINLI